MSLSLKKIQFYILLFIPPALMTGPFLSDLAVSMSGIIFLYIVIKERTVGHYFNKKVILIFFLWCLFLIFNSIFSSDYLLSLESSLFYFRFGLFSLAVWYMLENNDDFGKLFSYSLFTVFIFLLFDGFIQFFYGVNILGYEYQGGRLGSLFGDELVLGNFLSRLSPFLFAFIALYYSKSKEIFIFAMIILVLTDVLIFLAGERTGFFNLFLATFIILLFTENWKKIRAITFIISLILITIITFTVDTVKERVIDQTLSDFNLNSNYTLKENNAENNENEFEIKQNRIFFFSTRHEAMAKISFNMFLENPITGVGTKLFRSLCSDQKYYEKNLSKSTSCDTHPHNVFLQLLGETGIICTLPYLLLIVWIIYIFTLQSLYIFGISSKKVLSDFQVCLYAAVIVTIWPLIPSLNFFNNWISIIYYMPAGFLLYSHFGDKS